VTPGTNDPLHVLIASHFDERQVSRIEQVDPRIKVLYAPELLPIPRYTGDHHGSHRALSETELAKWQDLLACADVSFDFDWHRPADLRTTAPKLRWVQATSSGIGEFLIETGLIDSGITFTTAAGVHAVPLAEFVTLGLLYLVKEVPMLREQMRRHHWQRYTTHSLAGRRALVVGMGSVGRQVAQHLSALGLHVTGASRVPGTPPPGVREVVPLSALPGVLPDIDALVLCSPLSTATYHLIGAAELEAMPRGSLVVNVARGQIIDETALIAALESGHLGGAALDVFDVEPLPDDSPLWDRDDVLISPHSASTLADENSHIVDLFVRNLTRWLREEPLLNTFSRSDALDRTR
jgi:phosphoglycerate dehydrogenase-like enzyme